MKDAVVSICHVPFGYFKELYILPVSQIKLYSKAAQSVLPDSIVGYNF